jgi:hypothetical protein
MESAAGMEADDVMVKVAHHDCEPIKPSARVRTIAITKISRNNLLIWPSVDSDTSDAI